MSLEDYPILTSGDLAELILLSVITGVTFIVSRVWGFVEHNKETDGLNIFLKGIVICSISVIICYILDPFILPIEPRLILLPPAIIGIWGEQFVRILFNMDEALKLIVWIKAFIKNEELPESPDIINPTDNPGRHKELLDKVVDMQLEVNDACIEYHETKDKKVIFNCYKNTYKRMAQINLEIDSESKDDMENTVKQKIQELYAAYDRLLDIRRELMYRNKENPTPDS